MTEPHEPSNLSLHLERGRVVVTATGRIDASTAPHFRATLEAAIAATGVPGTLRLDLSQLDSLEPAGVAVLASAAARVRGAGGDISVHGANPLVFDVLSSARLLRPLDVDDSPAHTAMLQSLMSVAQSGQTQNLLDAALLLVVVMAHTVVAGADGVSITLPRQGVFSTVAASNEVVLAMDHDQYNTGEGPCLDAARTGKRFLIDSLEEERRWAQFVPRARARGIESVLSTPLIADGRPLGALNVYSRATGVFATHELGWAHQFADQAARLLIAAQRVSPSTELSGQLTDALRSREVIAQAQGMIMQRDKLGPAAAYTVLRTASHDSSRPLRNVAEHLLEDLVQHVVDPPPTMPEG